MGEIIFNKLVRDKIPEIIQQQGSSCSIRLLDNNEYLKELNVKLREEMQEYLESESIEELADIEEVLRAILRYKNVKYDDFEKLRQEKRDKRGGFDLKIFLESVTEKDME